MMQFVWNKWAIWTQRYPFNSSWNHLPEQEAKASLPCCRLWRSVLLTGGQRGDFWAHFCPCVMRGVFAVSSMLVVLIKLRSQLQHDCVQTFRWRAKESKNVCHAFKKIQKKKKEKYRFSMHEHSGASPRERQYSILFVGPEKLWLLF